MSSEPPKQSITDDSMATGGLEDTTTLSVSLVPSSHELPNVTTFGPTVASTQRLTMDDTFTMQLGQGLSTQAATMVDTTKLWANAEDETTVRQTRTENVESKFSAAIRAAKISNNDGITSLISRIYDTHYAKQKADKQGHNDVMKLCLAIGSVVDQVVTLGEIVTRNTEAIKEIGSDVSRIIDNHANLHSKVGDIVDHINRESERTDPNTLQLKSLEKSCSDLWERSDAQVAKLADLESRITILINKDISNGRETSRFQQDLTRISNGCRLENQRLDERLSASLGQISSIQKYLAAAQNDQPANADRLSTSQPARPTPIPQPHKMNNLVVPQPGGRQSSTLCFTCNVMFTNPRDLAVHNKKYHKDAATNPVMCNSCPARFPDQQSLVNHQFAKHPLPATAPPSMAFAKNMHLSYLIPDIRIPGNMSDPLQIEYEERRQGLEKLRQVRSDLDSLHIKQWQRLTHGRSIPMNGVPYTLMVTFYNEETRAMVHEANINCGSPLIPFVDHAQLEHARRQAEAGHAHFLGSGAGAGVLPAAGASTTPQGHATNASLPKPLQGQDGTGWAEANVARPAAPAPTMTRPESSTPMIMPASNTLPTRAIRPFLQPLAPLPPQSHHRGSSRGSRGRARGSSSRDA